MTPETTRLLYKVKDTLENLRKDLDTHMYYSGPKPDEDVEYCRKIYSRICKVLDLL